MRKLFTLFMIASASAFSMPLKPAFSLLPAHAIEAEASYVGGDAESERISQKMARAVARDAAWMKAYLAELNLKPGELLPYHPRFGVTRSEYEHLTSKKPTLVSLGRVTVDVENLQRNSRVTIASDKLRLSFLIDPVKESITTRRGELIARTKINAGAGTPLGAWKGEQWSRADERNGFSEKIAIGRSADGAVAIIYYDIRSPEEGLVSHFIIRYPAIVKALNDSPGARRPSPPR